MVSELSMRLKRITRSRPIRSTFKKDRDRTLIGKARVRARKAQNKAAWSFTTKSPKNE